jgi:hypothetical protein
MTGKEPGKLFMLDPVLMPHGSCTGNCSLTRDNSYYSCYSAIEVLITFIIDFKVIKKVYMFQKLIIG